MILVLKFFWVGFVGFVVGLRICWGFALGLVCLIGFVGGMFTWQDFVGLVLCYW